MKTNRTIFQILDLDRTLLDTPKLVRTLQRIIANEDPQLAETITEQLKQHTAARTSFFIFDFIAEHVGQEKLTEYVNKLNYAAPASELLLPGANDRIAFTKSQPGWSGGILTYGLKRDQTIKLKLVGLQMERYIITNSQKKGELIASWKQANGTYKLPIEFGGHTVDMVTLDDDKFIAFDGLPSDVSGQWITTAAIGGTVEMQKLSSNVRPVTSLQASVDRLSTKLAR
jgi:hypothetical protein